MSTSYLQEWRYRAKRGTLDCVLVNLLSKKQLTRKARRPVLAHERSQIVVEEVAGWKPPNPYIPESNE